MSTLRENSKKDWESPGTFEAISAGSLQRIADAVEKIAVNYDSLLRAKQSAEASRDNYCIQAGRLARRLCATRGHNTRLRKKLYAQECLSLGIPDRIR